MLIPDTGPVSGYSVAASSAFNGSYSEFQVVPYKVGYRSASAVISSISDGIFKSYSRFLFDPSDYAGSVPAVSDLKPIWIKIAPVSVTGDVGTYSAAQLLLPYSSVPNRVLNVNGTIGSSTVEIQLPYDCNAASIQVEGSDYMTVAFEPDGDTFRVDGVTASGTPLSTTFPTFNQVFITGSDTSVTFSMSVRLMNSSPA